MSEEKHHFARRAKRSEAAVHAEDALSGPTVLLSGLSIDLREQHVQSADREQVGYLALHDRLHGRGGLRRVSARVVHR